MARKPIKWPIFFAVDSLGLPLTDTILSAVNRGMPADAAILDFLLGAAEVEWNARKVRADVRETCRELRGLVPINDTWAVWADGGFDPAAENGGFDPESETADAAEAPATNGEE